MPTIDEETILNNLVKCNSTMLDKRGNVLQALYSHHISIVGTDYDGYNYMMTIYFVSNSKSPITATLSYQDYVMISGCFTMNNVTYVISGGYIYGEDITFIYYDTDNKETKTETLSLSDIPSSSVKEYVNLLG